MLAKIRKELAEGRTLFLFGFLKALGLIAPLVVARFFSEDTFGKYMLAKMVLFFFIAMFITTPQVPFVVYASGERGETGKINKSFSIQCVFFLSGIVLYSVIALLFNHQIRGFAEISAVDLIYVSAGFIGVALNFFLVNLFLALDKRIASSAAEFAFGIINLGLVVVLCFLNKLNLRNVFGAYFVSTVLVYAIFLKSIDIRQLFPFRFEFERFRGMFNFAKWVLLGATATTLIDWGDNIILKIFNISLADIGQYGLAYSIFNGVIAIIYTLNSYFLPFISEHINNREKMREYLFRKRPLIFLFGITVLAAGFIICPLFFKIIYPGSYQDSVLILRILLIGCVPVLYGTFYMPLLNALQLYKFSQTASIIIMLFKMCLNALLVLKYGFYGAACGTIVSYFCLTFIYEYYYRIKIKRALIGS